MSNFILTDKQQKTLARVLAPFVDQIERVGVFGSRATGRARPNSDIDLVIYGDMDLKSEWRLWTDLEDSDLAVSVDIVVYPRIQNALLKQHIDAISLPLFTHAELARERATAPTAYK